MTPNAKLAYRVLDHLTANPHQFDPTLAPGWYDTDGYTVAENTGTLIGGLETWACLLSGDRLLEDGFNGEYGVTTTTGDRDMYDRAVELLGLTPEVNDWVLGYDENDTVNDLAKNIAEVFGPRPDARS